MNAAIQLLSLALLFLSIVLAVPVGVFVLQIFAACLPPRSSSLQERAAGARPRLAVLVPAHNEAAGLGATLAGLAPQLVAGDRLLVVADNCSDSTADVARAAGASVTERSHATQLGKGYALDHGLAVLTEGLPPDVVVMIDADCRVEPGVLEHLACTCAATGRPVQADYAMELPEPRAGARLRRRVAGFAWAVKNSLRPAGAARLGAPCQLTGTGMAFPWAVLRQTSVASGHIVEDMKLGLDLARLGHAPLYAPQARVLSWFAREDAASAGQRTRWEHGHLMTLLSETPRLVRAAVHRRDLGLLALAADLAVPPLALLAMTTAGVLLASALLSAFYGSSFASSAFVWAGVEALVLVGAIVLAWQRVGRGWLAGHELLAAPLYALWKIPMYLRFVLGRQVAWVRAKRDGE